MPPCPIPAAIHTSFTKTLPAVSPINATAKFSGLAYLMDGDRQLAAVYVSGSVGAGSASLAFANELLPAASSIALASTERSPQTCFSSGTYSIYKDIHDGDEKRIDFLTNDSILIRPFGNNETWSVSAPLDRATCSAVVDFRVKGKPSPPPCKLSVIFLRLTQFTGEIIGSLAQFSDPSGTLPPGPLNTWVALPG
jgi:hypothetical protein